jgi:hypothetical protein
MTVARDATDAGAAPRKTYTFSCSVTDDCKKAPYDERTIRAAAREAFDKVFNTDCIKSYSLRDNILGRFDGLTIDCSKSTGECAKTLRIFSQTVTVETPALDAGRCGPLASTILHEVVHQAGFIGQGDGVTTACEASCFGYGGGDATKCK